MLWCETGRSDPRGIEQLAVFVSQLHLLGVDAGIDIRALPAELHRTARFDIAPYLREGPVEPEDRVALVAANRLEDARLMELRRLLGAEPRECVAFGRFEARQKLVSVTAKLSYVFNREPQVINLAEQGTLGLVCDPLGGLVELPCVFRNATGAAIALAAVEMAMAGITFAIPADEVIDTMGEIGREMDVRYRETAGGGLAATPTGRRLARERLVQIKRS